MTNNDLSPFMAELHPTPLANMLHRDSVPSQFTSVSPLRSPSPFLVSNIGVRRSPSPRSPSPAPSFTAAAFGTPKLPCAPAINPHNWPLPAGFSPNLVALPPEPPPRRDSLVPPPPPPRRDSLIPPPPPASRRDSLIPPPPPASRRDSLIPPPPPELDAFGRRGSLPPPPPACTPPDVDASIAATATSMNGDNGMAGVVVLRGNGLGDANGATPRPVGLTLDMSSPSHFPPGRVLSISPVNRKHSLQSSSQLAPTTIDRYYAVLSGFYTGDHIRYKGNVYRYQKGARETDPSKRYDFLDERGVEVHLAFDERNEPRAASRVQTFLFRALVLQYRYALVVLLLLTLLMISVDAYLFSRTPNEMYAKWGQYELITLVSLAFVQLFCCMRLLRVLYDDAVDAREADATAPRNPVGARTILELLTALVVLVDIRLLARMRADGTLNDWHLTSAENPTVFVDVVQLSLAVAIVSLLAGSVFNFVPRLLLLASDLQLLRGHGWIDFLTSTSELLLSATILSAMRLSYDSFVRWLLTLDATVADLNDYVHVSLSYFVLVLFGGQLRYAFIFGGCCARLCRKVRAIPGARMLFVLPFLAYSLVLAATYYSRDIEPHDSVSMTIGYTIARRVYFASTLATMFAIFLLLLLRAGGVTNVINSRFPPPITL